MADEPIKRSLVALVLWKIPMIGYYEIPAEPAP